MSLASQAARNLGSVASNYAGQASGIAGSLVPFAQRQLTNPSGYSPQDLTSMLVAGQAGAGGATSGIVGHLAQTAAATNNAGGFAGASDEAARQQAKAAAGSAEGIAAQNAGVKLDQQHQAGSILSGLYGTDVGAQGQAQGQQNQANEEANQEGFFARLQQISNMLTQGAQSASGLAKSGLIG